MPRKYAEVRLWCDAMLRGLQPGWQTRDELLDMSSVLHSVVTLLEHDVRNAMVEDPDSADARAARSTLIGIRTQVLWLEEHRFGVMQCELHDVLDRACHNGIDLVTTLERVEGMPEPARWAGRDRRGAGRRVLTDRRASPRSCWDRRITQRRESRPRQCVWPVAT